MAHRGFALYKKDGDLYLMSVAYEYPDTRFVGFNNTSDIYKIEKNKNDKNLSNFISIGDYILYKVQFGNFPKGKPYTQLPGGGGVYKETRKYNNVYELFDNFTFLKAVEKYISINESNLFLKKLVSEIALKKEIQKISFTAVSIEKESEIRKMNEIVKLLIEKGVIPDTFIRPSFKNGDIDYHMTIKLGELPNTFKTDINKEVVLNVNTIGISEDAIALGVSGNYFSDNEFQHITLAFKDRPESSKSIKNWIKLEKPFAVVGVIREFSKGKEKIKRGVFVN